MTQTLTATSNATDLERSLETLLQDSDQLCDAIKESISEAGESAPEELYVDRVTTFLEAGVMSSNSGLVLKLSDGTEYQLSIVQSK